MKKRIFAAVLAALCMCAASCGTETKAPAATAKEEVKEYSFDAGTVTEEVLAEITINSAIEKGIDDLEFYFTELDTTKLTDASYYMCASGAYPDEIAVFVFDTADSAAAAESAVKTRLDKQVSVYESYTPEEMYKLEDAIVEVRQNVIFYAVTENNSRVQEIFDSFIG